MAHTIKLKRTSTAGNKPDNTNITTGELALNTADKSLYIQTGTANTDIVTLYDDGILHLDDTNNRVGIGTTAPSEKLHVNGNIRLQGTNSLVLNTNGSLRYSSSAGAVLLSNGSSEDVKIRTVNNANAGDIILETDESERLRILGSNGNVGIGISAPTTPLAVQSNSSAQGITILGRSSDDISQLDFVENDGTSVGGFQARTTDFRVRSVSNIPLLFMTNNTERARIHSNGQLGIGVTDFTNALRSNGKQLIIGDCFVGTSAALVVDDFSRFAGPIYFHEDSSTNAANSTAIDNNGNRLVITGKNGTTANALDAPDGFYVGGTQFINSSRNLVNIGTVTTSGNIVINSNSALLAARKIAARDTSGLAIATSDGTERIAVLNSGAVRFNNAFVFPTAIGTAGQVLKVPTSGTTLYWADEASATTQTSIADADGDTKIQVEESTDEDKIRFDTAGSERMVVDSTGLTIGSATDTTTLVFPDKTGIPDNPTETNDKVQLIKMGQGGNGGMWQASGRGAMLISSADDSLVLANGDAGRSYDPNAGGHHPAVANETLALLSDFDIRFTTGLQEGWSGGTNYSPKTSIFTSAGRLGVNTTSPATPLHVMGTMRSQAEGSSTFADYKNQQLYVNTGSYTIAVNGPIHLADQNNNKVLTVDNGNDRVGIGTTAPGATLHSIGHSRLDGAILQKSNLSIGSGNISTGNEYISHNGPILTNGSTGNINQYGYFRGYQAVYGTDGTNGYNPYAQGAYSNPVFEFVSNNRGSMSLPTDSAIRGGYLYQFVLGNSGSGGSNGGVELTNSNTTLLWGITSSNHAYFANRVGINNNSPNYALDVTATGGGINIGGSGAYLRWNSGDIQIKNEGSYKMGFYTYNSSDAALNRHMVIDTNGNVGIGADSPANSLEIATSDPIIRLRDTDTGARTILSASSGVGGFIINADAGNTVANSYIDFKVDNTTRMYINASGNVGIGTSTPSRKLHVSTNNVGIATSYGVLIVEATDSQADLISDSSGTWGSGINLVEGAGTSNTDIWSIVRQTTGGNGDSSLRFNFGTGNNHENANKVTFASNGNATFTGALSSGNITTTGYLRGPSTFTIDPAAHGNNTGTVVIAGDLQVDGTTTTINSTTLTVDDLNITLASGATNAAAANGAGLTVDCGSGTNATLTYDGTNDEWDFNKNVKVSGSVGVTNIVTNKVVKFNGTILDDSNITDTGSSITLGSNTTVSGTVSSGAITSSGNLLISKTDPTITLFDNSGANTNPNGTIIFSEVSGTNNFKINYNGANDRLEFRGLIGSTDTEIVRINRGTNPALHIFGRQHLEYSVQALANRAYGLVVRGNDSGNTGEAASIFLGGIHNTVRGAYLAAEIQSTSNDHDLIIATSGPSAEPIERMRVTGDGTVGIGQSLPSAKLHVKDANFPQLKLEDADDTMEIGYSGANFFFKRNDNDGAIIFRRVDNSDIMAVDMSTKRVGIGTASPTYGLQVMNDQTSQSATGTMYVQASLNGSGKGLVIDSNTRTTSDNSVAALETITRANTTGLKVQVDGKVGIGASAPGAQLHLSTGNNSLPTLDGGTLFVIDTTQGGTGNYAAMSILSGTSGVSSLYFGDEDAENRGAVRYFNTSNDLAFSTNGQERVRIDDTGNVGIGQNNPTTRKLEVYHSANAATGILVENANTGTGAYAGISFKNDAGGSVLPGVILNGSNQTAYAGANSLNVYQFNQNPIGFVTGNSLRMAIQGDGKVGVGTNSPQGKFQVNGDIIVTANDAAYTAEYFAKLKSSYNENPLALESRAGDVIRASNYGQNLTFLTGSNSTGTSEKMTIDANGNIVVGVSTPFSIGGTAKLSLSTNTNVYLTAGATSSDLIYSRRQGSGHYQTQTYLSNNTGTLELQPYGGNVGIGTSGTVSSKLQVEALGIDTTTTTTSATTEVTIDSFAAATFRSARYTIQVTNTTDSTYHITEILLIHNGTTPNITEYGTVFTGTAAEATFDADISSGSVRLRATPASTDSMTFKVVRHCITV